MRARKAGFLVLLMFVVLVAACQEGFRIIVSDAGDRSPEFRLESTMLMSREGVEIEYFAVHESDPERKSVKVMWQIASVDKLPRRMLNIRYGVLPAGFRETTAPATLTAGSKYGVGGGMPGKIGFGEFVLK